MSWKESHEEGLHRARKPKNSQLALSLMNLFIDTGGLTPQIGLLFPLLLKSLTAQHRCEHVFMLWVTKL